MLSPVMETGSGNGCLAVDLLGHRAIPSGVRVASNCIWMGAVIFITQFTEPNGKSNNTRHTDNTKLALRGNNESRWMSQWIIDWTVPVLDRWYHHHHYNCHVLMYVLM